jgi:hypothetical protein
MLTTDQIERCTALWRRLYARGAVRWMEGMALRVESTGASCGHLSTNALRVHNAWREDPNNPSLWDAIGACVPDWNAPTVLGCLTAMAREATGDPALCARLCFARLTASPRWRAEGPDEVFAVADNEPEALLLAIEEAQR